MTNSGSSSITAGAGNPTNLPSTGVAWALCDAATFNCFGWSLYGTNTATMAASGTSAITYSAVFASGTVYAVFSTTVPSTTDVLGLFGTSGTLTDVSTSKSVAGYGFSNVYWYTDAATTSSWPKGELAYRF